MKERQLIIINKFYNLSFFLAFSIFHIFLVLVLDIPLDPFAKEQMQLHHFGEIPTNPVS